MSKFQFSNVVVVDEGRIGVIVKSWEDDTHDVYVRSYNEIFLFSAEHIEHFIYDKEVEE